MASMTVKLRPNIPRMPDPLTMGFSLICFLLRRDGAGERNRTVDLRITSALLCQLSYAGPERVRNSKPGGPTGQRQTEFPPPTRDTESPRKYPLNPRSVSAAGKM